MIDALMHHWLLVLVVALSAAIIVWRFVSAVPVDDEEYDPYF